MANCSDTGLQGSSPRDARFMKFVADGPGISGFSMKPDPEEDGDAFAASFDPFLRPESTTTCFSEWDDDGRHLSLEALAAESGFEPASLLDGDDDRDEEPDRWEMSQLCAEADIEYVHYKPSVHIDDMNPKYLVERPEGTILVHRSPEVEAQTNADRRQGSPVFNTAARCQQAVEATWLVSEALMAEEEAQKAAAAAAPKPVKGNGNGHAAEVQAQPAVGKFLTGTVIDQGPKGLLVDAGGIEARVPIALEMGHGSWERAAAWVLGFKPGMQVRLMVQYVNGHIEAVLTTRHRRPDGWQPPKWACRRSRQEQAPVAN